jgi:hypothetical protein
MLDYLPSDIDTVIGQNELLDEFGTGSFSLIVVEGMSTKQVSALKSDIETVDHVKSVIWYDDFADADVPISILPRKLRCVNSGDATLMAVFFDTGTSRCDDQCHHAIRSIAGSHVLSRGCRLWCRS